MNLRKENAGEENSNRQVQQKKKICGPFLIGYQAWWRESCWSVSENLEERKVQSNQIIYAGSLNFKISFKT